MIRKRILLASFLKPVTDARLYKKIGQSLAKLPELEVHMAGYAAPLPGKQEAESVSFHPIFDFKRLSAGRITAQARFWKLLQKVKPDLLIIGTHELLPLAWVYCKLHSCRLIYDVQENYFLNLTTQGVYPGRVGKLAGQMVQGYEKLFAQGVDYFFLAETSYAKELPFLGKRYTVVQNKFLPSSTLSTASARVLPVTLMAASSLRLLYSGTISRLYGVLEAVEFTRQLRAWVPDAQLTIIGYCADQHFLQELKEVIAPLPFVTLMGGSTLVPHDQILAQEQEHHLGLLPYHPHPSTARCIPTKLFEYLGNGLPVITSPNPLWQELMTIAGAGIAHDFSQELSAATVEKILTQTYYPNGIPGWVNWQEEETKVQQVVKTLLNF
jgi:glycogen synthase